MKENEFELEIGSFDYEDIEVKHEALSFKNVNIRDLKGNCKIQVKGLEGVNIPHIHIICTNFECCVSLLRSEYFNHEEHMKEMPSKAEKSFYEFMKKNPSSDFIKNNPEYIDCKTNYEVACKAWTRANDPNFVIPLEAINNNYCLNYSKIINPNKRK